MSTLSATWASILGIAIALALYLRWGLPATLRTFGLHPDYQGTYSTYPGGRALVVTTSHSTLGDGGPATGVFGSEMTAPYYAFLDAGMAVDVASIRGGSVPIEPMSFRWFLAAESDKRYQRDTIFQNKVANSLPIESVDFGDYDIIFLAGGWGAAYDLGCSEVLGQKISAAWAAGKVIGGVCHGPLGLLLATEPDGQALVCGKRLTAVTDRQVSQLGITQTPQHPERELRQAGAQFESSTAFRDIFATHVVADGRLVTGQNQNSSTATAQRMLSIAAAQRD
jgi:putative intracellular protease/amidase